MRQWKGFVVGSVWCAVFIWIMGLDGSKMVNRGLPAGFLHFLAALAVANVVGSLISAFVNGDEMLAARALLSSVGFAALALGNVMFFPAKIFSGLNVLWTGPLAFGGVAVVLASIVSPFLLVVLEDPDKFFFPGKKTEGSVSEGVVSKG